MQGRSHADEKQMPPPCAYAEDNSPNDMASSVVTKPRSAIRRLLAFVVGASPKTTERFASAKRRWSFATRFMPSGPDTFYLSATPETRGNAIEQSHSINEELPLRFGMMYVSDADHHIMGLQGSPSSESQIAMIMDGTALSEPNPTSLPVATDRDCIQTVYPEGGSLGNHQLCPPVDFFAIHNEALLDQPYRSVDLDTEMDDVENAMSVDYTPLSASDFLLSSTALPVIPYTGPPDLRFSNQLFFGAEGNHHGQITSGIGNGSNPFHSTSCQHPVTPGPSRTDDGPADTKEDDDVFVPSDNVLRRPPLEAPSAVVEENEVDGLCTQNANPPPAFLEACRTSLIPQQYQPEVRERESDAETDVDSKDEAELREPFERETTEPLEEGEDKPPAAFLRFDQGVSTGSLQDSIRVSSLPSRQNASPTEHDSLGLKSSLPETPFVEEGQEKLLATLNVEAERLLESLERKLCSPPRVPQQIMPSTTGDNESSEPFEREGTEPLEDGEDQTPTTFLNFEQRTDTRPSQQYQSSTINDDRLEPFERETTEPLEEGEDQTPTVFLSYERRVTPNCLGDNNVDALSPIPKSADNRNEPDRSFVRESTEPLEDGEGEPPAAFIPPGATLEHRVTTQSTTPSTSPRQMVYFSPIQSQPEPQASYNIPHSNRRLVLNKHGRPIRPLSRAMFKRTLGGAPCDLSSLANTAPWPPSGAGAGDDGDEREDRKDPSKRARCDIYKVPTDQGSNKQVRFGGSRRAHFHNAVARFSVRSQGPVTPRPSTLRSTGNETQLPTSPLSNIPFIAPPPSGVVGTATQRRSPPPSISLSRTNSRSNKNPRKTQVTETITESDSDGEPPRKPAHLLVDELDRKRRRAPHHLPTEASGGAVRHTRRRHKEDWIHERRKRGCPTDDSTSWFLGEPRKQKRKGPLSGISVRFRLPDIQPVGA